MVAREEVGALACDLGSMPQEQSENGGSTKIMLTISFYKLQHVFFSGLPVLTRSPFRRNNDDATGVRSVPLSSYVHVLIPRKLRRGIYDILYILSFRSIAMCTYSISTPKTRSFF